MNSESENFCIFVLDAIAHGPFFDEQKLYENTGYEKYGIETKINDIKKGKININNDPELKILLLKSLALLTIYPHNHDNELNKYTNFEKEKLKEILDKLYGKVVGTDEYFNILNL